MRLTNRLLQAFQTQHSYFFEAAKNLQQRVNDYSHPMCLRATGPAILGRHIHNVANLSPHKVKLRLMVIAIPITFGFYVKSLWCRACRSVWSQLLFCNDCLLHSQRMDSRFSEDEDRTTYPEFVWNEAFIGIGPDVIKPQGPCAIRYLTFFEAFFWGQEANPGFQSCHPSHAV